MSRVSQYRTSCQKHFYVHVDHLDSRLILIDIWLAQDDLAIIVIQITRWLGELSLKPDRALHKYLIEVGFDVCTCHDGFQIAFPIQICRLNEAHTIHFFPRTQ